MQTVGKTCHADRIPAVDGDRSGNEVFCMYTMCWMYAYGQWIHKRTRVVELQVFIRAKQCAKAGTTTERTTDLQYKHVAEHDIRSTRRQGKAD
jgi:hypothetical protein